MESETIAAIATALGSSGIGIVRISGEAAAEVADRIFRSPGGRKIADGASHTIHDGYIYDGKKAIDEVLVMWMKAPRSFTSEDTVEINCHGGVYVVKKVLELALQNGARLAEPGEFTKRAFLNGRIDLAQAEAVMDLIESQNEYALEASVGQLRGNVSACVEELRSAILYEAAYIESALDDPEHISLDGYGEKLRPKLQSMEQKMEKLINSFENGRRLTEGIKTVITGKPNAGKSSILNLLAGEERAIVTDVAGTTRDVLEEDITLDDICLRLLDTAGIRHTSDTVESIGVERALKHMKDADLVLYVMDLATEPDENDERILRELQGRQYIVLLNKTDLENNGYFFESEIRHFLQRWIGDSRPIFFSAVKGTGLDELTDEIRRRFFEGHISFNDQVYITSVRHKKLLTEALESLKMVDKSIDQEMPEDFYSIDLMDAYKKLGLILGEEVEDDLADEIFHRFCMGK